MNTKPNSLTEAQLEAISGGDIMLGKLYGREGRVAQQKAASAAATPAAETQDSFDVAL